MSNDGLDEQVERLRYKVDCEEFHARMLRLDTSYLDYLKQQLKWFGELQGFRNQYGNYIQKDSEG